MQKREIKLAVRKAAAALLTAAVIAGGSFGIAASGVVISGSDVIWDGNDDFGAYPFDENVNYLTNYGFGAYPNHNSTTIDTRGFYNRQIFVRSDTTLSYPVTFTASATSMTVENGVTLTIDPSGVAADTIIFSESPKLTVDNGGKIVANAPFELFDGRFETGLTNNGVVEFNTVFGPASKPSYFTEDSKYELTVDGTGTIVAGNGFHIIGRGYFEFTLGEGQTLIVTSGAAFSNNDAVMNVNGVLDLTNYNIDGTLLNIKLGGDAIVKVSDTANVSDIKKALGIGGINDSVKLVLTNGDTVTVDKDTPDVSVTNVAMETALAAVKKANYVTTQEIASTEDSAKATVEDIVKKLSLSGVTAGVEYAADAYVAAVAGTSENIKGTNGSLAFTVKLNKSGVPEQTWSGVLTITATEYTAPYTPPRSSPSYSSRSSGGGSGGGRNPSNSTGLLSSGTTATSSSSGKSAAGSTAGTSSKTTKLSDGRTAADTLVNGKVAVRTYVSETQAFALGDAKTTVQLAGTRVEKTTNKIKNFYKDTPFHIVSFDQQGKFDTSVETAIKLPADIGTTGLVLYNYDAATNTLVRIKDADMKFDVNGFLHFTTEYAGDIIVSKGQLARK